MSNRNNRRDANKGPNTGAKQAPGPNKSQNGEQAAKQNQGSKGKESTKASGWESMWTSKPAEPKSTMDARNAKEFNPNQAQSAKAAFGAQQQDKAKNPSKQGAKQPSTGLNKGQNSQPKNTELKIEKANSSAAYEMDEAIVSVDTQQKPTFSNKKREERKAKEAQNPIFSGFGETSKPQANKNRNERELTKTHKSWVTGNGSQKENENLNDLASTPFDQFANRKTTYKESLYNTAIDMNNISQEQVKYAQKIQAEINAADSKGNIHLAEERNQIGLRDNEDDKIIRLCDNVLADEEQLYSGVVRAPKLKNPKRFSGLKMDVMAKPFAKLDSCVQTGPRNAQSKTGLLADTWTELAARYQTKGEDPVRTQIKKLQQPSTSNMQFQAPRAAGAGAYANQMKPPADQFGYGQQPQTFGHQQQNAPYGNMAAPYHANGGYNKGPIGGNRKYSGNYNPNKTYQSNNYVHHSNYQQPNQGHQNQNMSQNQGSFNYQQTSFQQPPQYQPYQQHQKPYNPAKTSAPVFVPTGQQINQPSAPLAGDFKPQNTPSAVTSAPEFRPQQTSANTGMSLQAPGFIPSSSTAAKPWTPSLSAAATEYKPPR